MPWWINPWAEVSRLRDRLAKAERDLAGRIYRRSTGSKAAAVTRKLNAIAAARAATPTDEASTAG